MVEVPYLLSKWTVQRTRQCLWSLPVTVWVHPQFSKLLYQVLVLLPFVHRFLRTSEMTLPHVYFLGLQQLKYTTYPDIFLFLLVSLWLIFVSHLILKIHPCLRDKKIGLLEMVGYMALGMDIHMYYPLLPIHFKEHTSHHTFSASPNNSGAAVMASTCACQWVVQWCWQPFS